MKGRSTAVIRLLAIDMDETCLNHKKIISDQTMDALHQAVDSGIIVVPTTGRALACLPYQLKGQPFYQYVISSNGAVVTDLKNNRDLFQENIPAAVAAEFLEQCDASNVGISAHINHDFILQGHALRLLGKVSYGKDASYSKYAKNIAALLRSSQMDVEEIQLFYFNESMKERGENLLSKYDCFLESKSNHYTELYSPNTSKGNALSALANYLGIVQDEIACIGDAENDISMFQASGLKFAMGNAIPELKELADVVVPSNNEDGVAFAIKHHLL